jgi:hypothetical protein
LLERKEEMLLERKARDASARRIFLELSRLRAAFAAENLTCVTVKLEGFKQTAYLPGGLIR